MMNNTFSGQTLVASSSSSSGLPPHLSGASPTTYYCNNIIWQQVVDSRKKEVQMRELAPQVEIISSSDRYSRLHGSPFEDHSAEQIRSLVENSSTSVLNQQDPNGNTPIMWAVSQGRDDIVQLLVDQGANINAQNYVGETALYLAAGRGYSGLCIALLENGADVTLTTLDGSAVAHIAAAGGYVDVLRILAKNGAYLNALDEEGDTPLHWAVREGQEKTVEFLVKDMRVDVEVKNEDLETPLMLASCLGESRMSAFLSSVSKENVESMEL